MGFLRKHASTISALVALADFILGWFVGPHLYVGRYQDRHEGRTEVGRPLTLTKPADNAGTTILTGTRETPGGILHINVLSDSYAWLLGDDGSRSRVEWSGRPLESREMVRLLSSRALQAQIGEATDVIAVGTASCEGQDRRTEEERAERRAVQILRWLREADRATNLLADKFLWTLNLGQYQDLTCAGPPERTRNQRRIVVLTMQRKVPALDKMHLLQAMSATEDVSIHHLDYSTNDLERWSAPGRQSREPAGR